MKWKKQEYKILTKTHENIQADTVKGYITDIDGGYKLGVHKNEFGHWTLTDIETGTMILNTCLDDTLKGHKEYLECNELTIRNLLDKAYKDTAKVEKYKKIVNSNI